jgi:hypothetical protein
MRAMRRYNHSRIEKPASIYPSEIVATLSLAADDAFNFFTADSNNGKPNKKPIQIHSVCLLFCE